MKGFIIAIYLIFCIGYVAGLDNGKPWTAIDYLCAALSPLIIPIVVGITVAKITKEKLSARLGAEIKPAESDTCKENSNYGKFRPN